MSARPVISHHEESHGSFKSYTAGFVLSITLTLLAYAFASHQVARGWGLIYLLAVLAVIQLFIQLVFFLHLGRESKPRWNLTVFSFALMVVVIVVFGTLWIMKNLSYDHHTLSPQQASQYLVKDEGY
ncbi:MAG TPA: cytochrome o ubiquinol oxidase subunit IV [Verrucomicrobiae bacterium]|nr:cytochrome o ubiquinol oxidase subunit IV [Verrucomicrobiae bacterium]